MNAKIVALEVFVLRAPTTDRPHWVSHFSVATANEILVRLRTNDGVEGFGLATTYASAEPIVQAFRTGVGEQVLGMDPPAPERLHEKLFALDGWRMKKGGAGKLSSASLPPSISPAGTSLAKWPDCRCIACSADTAIACPAMSHAHTTATERTSSNCAMKCRC
jgi:hypothetical protein